VQAQPSFIEAPPPTLEDWAERIGRMELPVLRRTLAALESLRASAHVLDARTVAGAVSGDPLMAARVFSHLALQRSRASADVATVERAIVMLGIPPFFRAFGGAPTVEERLLARRGAHAGLLRVLRRARRAVRYAYELSTWRNDPGAEEIGLAALLHDLAEMLLWCHAPSLASRVRAVQAARRGVRSAVAQRAVLGIALADLQLALARRWRLPELFAAMMDEAHAANPRVRSVLLAVRLARHSAQRWSDPALPDDYRDIAELLCSTPERVREMLIAASVGGRR
jgi:HD-like signal output (HDOD) protein